MNYAADTVVRFFWAVLNSEPSRNHAANHTKTRIIAGMMKKTCCANSTVMAPPKYPVRK